MVALVVVGLVAGFATAISPCVLPVLPVIFAGGATGSRRRAVAIVVGLAASFAVATMFSVAVLTALDLPLDLLTDVGLALLALLAVGLLVDPVGRLLERPFARLGTRAPVGAGTSSGLLLGAGLGLLFVPCAGPVLAAITAAAASRRFTGGAFALTAAYAVGVALPLLAMALASQWVSQRWSAVRAHARAARRVAGVVIGAMAVVLATGVAAPLQTLVPSWSSSIEQSVVSPAIQAQLQTLKGEHANGFAAKQHTAPRGVALPEEGEAPAFTGITAWLNTPGDRPLTLAQLQGKVVLVDFWTYSCINCRRTLPHVEAWYRAYRRYGLVVVGVHTPEFAFEHVVGNVSAAAQQLGVTYPIAVDDDYATWDAYNQEYWPAEYLIDQEGQVRHEHFGEGQYAEMEHDLRLLLIAGGARHLPPPTEVADTTPSQSEDVALTPESYVGYDRLDNTPTQIVQGTASRYVLPRGLAPDELAFGGTWDVQANQATAGADAVLQLHYSAKDVYLVLSGHGTVTASVGDAPARTVRVSGIPNLYTLVAGRTLTSGVLTLHLSPGLHAFDFTFG
jgi:cytochrome c biogenesis protein CcdA/thiol-disulfide isomerase/thioredoxin